MQISGIKISVIGAFRSGIGAAKLAKRFGATPFVSDASDNEKVKTSVKQLMAENILFEIGEHSEKVYDCNLMVASPGVPADAPVLKNALKRKIKVISELEFAASFCKANIIAITGTNGKTTTTSLCAHLFNACGAKTYSAGNIGVAFSEIAADLKDDEYVSLEVSSFQLDLIDKFKPKVAMILNITPDHLNRYENKYENYIASKLRIYKNQDGKDFLILNSDNESIINSITVHQSKDFFFSLTKEQVNGCTLNNGKIEYRYDGKIDFRCDAEDIFIRGEHNIANAMSVICAAKIFGFDNDKIREGLKSFQGVEHRLELVRQIGGVQFINDSKATNVDSVWYALKSFNEPIFLILGGLDKGNDYNQIKDLVLQKVKKIYAVGSSAEKVFNFFHNLVKVEIKKTLEEIAVCAINEARENEIVLLSPACASFDMFDNYEHRGEVFKKAVNEL